MSTTTTNLGLIKPELTDPADITATNPNWDKIDKECISTKGGIINGNLTANYITGKWLQATEENHSTLNAKKVAIFDNNGWLYNRTPSEIVSDAGVVSNIKTYYSLEQLGLSVGSETIDGISRTLPANSQLILEVNVNCNSAIYPENLGTMIVYKASDLRVIFEFVAKATFNRYYGAAYYSDSEEDWSGWIGTQTKITSGTAAPSGGSDGDVYIQIIS
jgi:hypothetical protein